MNKEHLKMAETEAGGNEIRDAAPASPAPNEADQKKTPPENEDQESTSKKKDWLLTPIETPLMLLFTFVIAAATVAYAVISWRQLGVIEEQQKLASRALAQSEKALDATVRTFQMDQRPWLTAPRFTLSSELENNKSFWVTYWTYNGGKTPALDEYSQPVVQLRSVQSPLAGFVEPQAFRSVSIIPPATTGTPSLTDPLTPPAQIVALYLKKELLLFVQVRIRYRDVFGKRHWTTVCAYHIYGTPLDTFNYCPAGNEMDTD